MANSTPSPFTAEDLSVQYDDTHWYPFVEGDLDEITGFGHQDKDEFARQVTAFDRYAKGDTTAEWAAGDITHRWAVVTQDGDKCTSVDVTSNTPKAFPVTTIWGLR